MKPATKEIIIVIVLFAIFYGLAIFNSWNKELWMALCLVVFLWGIGLAIYYLASFCLKMALWGIGFVIDHKPSTETNKKPTQKKEGDQIPLS
ncbi:MAG: hypothetical protein WC823_02525 [Parcubacteria group bacterium]|jgi:hypothetical protein